MLISIRFVQLYGKQFTNAMCGDFLQLFFSTLLCSNFNFKLGKDFASGQKLISFQLFDIHESMIQLLTEYPK